MISHKFTAAGRFRRGLALNLATHSGEFLAEMDTRAAQMLTDTDHFRPQVRARRGDRLAVFGNAIGQEPNLPSHLGELADHLLAQRVNPSAEAGYRLQHEVEARPELLHN